jgi:hypothetical protein
VWYSVETAKIDEVQIRAVLGHHDTVHCGPRPYNPISRDRETLDERGPFFYEKEGTPAGRRTPQRRKLYRLT